MPVTSGFRAPPASLCLLVLAACSGAEPEVVRTNADSTASRASEVWQAGPDLPEPIANNAVAALEVDGQTHVYTFMGLDSTKLWSGVHARGYEWVVGEGGWSPLPAVPGPGRLAGTAQAWEGRVYVFGGYTVAEDGSESSLPNVDIYEPLDRTWRSGAPIPVPVDDAVSGIWRDSLIVLVSGWHDTDNVSDVQWYDPAADRWVSGPPIPGTPVFGHAGAVAGDHVVYVGGANTRGTRPRYQIEPGTWAGRIVPDAHPSQVGGAAPAVDWVPADTHPGPLRYRAAAAGVEDWVVFAGGTDNPYNYSGIGYDGVPAQATTSVFGFHGPTGRWSSGPPLPAASMDHRTLGVAGGRVFLVGGMDGAQQVVRHVRWARAPALTAALDGARPSGPGGR